MATIRLLWRDENIVVSSMDSGLEAFSHNPTDGSLTAVAVQPTVNTNYLNQQVGGQAVLGRQNILPTPWLTERHGYDPTSKLWRDENIVVSSMDSGLEAFSHNPTDGSLTAMAVQPTVNTN